MCTIPSTQPACDLPLSTRAVSSTVRTEHDRADGSSKLQHQACTTVLSLPHMEGTGMIATQEQNNTRSSPSHQLDSSFRIPESFQVMPDSRPTQIDEENEAMNKDKGNDTKSALDGVSQNRQNPNHEQVHWYTALLRCRNDPISLGPPALDPPAGPVHLGSLIKDVQSPERVLSRARPETNLTRRMLLPSAIPESDEDGESADEHATNQDWSRPGFSIFEDPSTPDSGGMPASGSRDADRENMDPGFGSGPREPLRDSLIAPRTATMYGVTSFNCHPCPAYPGQYHHVCQGPRCAGVGADIRIVNWSNSAPFPNGCIVIYPNDELNSTPHSEAPVHRQSEPHTSQPLPHPPPLPSPNIPPPIISPPHQGYPAGGGLRPSVEALFPRDLFGEMGNSNATSASQAPHSERQVPSARRRKGNPGRSFRVKSEPESDTAHHSTQPRVAQGTQTDPVALGSSESPGRPDAPNAATIVKNEPSPSPPGASQLASTQNVTRTQFSPTHEWCYSRSASPPPGWEQGAAPTAPTDTAATILDLRESPASDSWIPSATQRPRSDQARPSASRDSQEDIPPSAQPANPGVKVQKHVEIVEEVEYIGDRGDVAPPSTQTRRARSSVRHVQSPTSVSASESGQLTRSSARLRAQRVVQVPPSPKKRGTKKRKQPEEDPTEEEERDDEEDTITWMPASTQDVPPSSQSLPPSTQPSSRATGRTPTRRGRPTKRGRKTRA